MLAKSSGESDKKLAQRTKARAVMLQGTVQGKFGWDEPWRLRAKGIGTGAWCHGGGDYGSIRDLWTSPASWLYGEECAYI